MLSARFFRITYVYIYFIFIFIYKYFSLFKKKCTMYLKKIYNNQNYSYGLAKKSQILNALVDIFFFLPINFCIIRKKSNIF